MMGNLVRAEARKLLSTQVWFWLLLTAVALAALLIIVRFTTDGGGIQAGDVQGIVTTGLTAYVPAFILGVLGVTTEFRYQTITPTLLATPSRWALMTAKLITYAVVGVVMAAACLITTLAIALPWLAAKHVQYSFWGDGVGQRLFAVFGIVALYALLGLGFGAAIRNQIAAVTIGVIYLLIVEGLLGVIPKVQKVFPVLTGGGRDAILTPHDDIGNGVHLFGVAGGFAVLVIWALGLSAAGAAYSLNRDIT